MLLLHTVLNVACKLCVVAACCLGIVSSWKIARAGLLFRQDDAPSVRAAIRIEPDAWPYYVRLSQLDEVHAPELLRKALSLDPFDAQAQIDLALTAEADGDYLNAEKHLKEAFAIDRTWLPRWSLANFYLRRGNLPQFWEWAEQAAQMHPQDVGQLFEICARVEPDPAVINARIVGSNPALTRGFLDFLLGRNQVAAAAVLASRLLLIGEREPDLPTLFQVVNRLVLAGDPATSSVLWRQLMSRGWVFADAALPYNGSFARDPLPVLFDWSLTARAGVHSWIGPDGLSTELTGTQPENCVIAEQVVPLMPAHYRLEIAYRTSGIPPGTGLRWQLLNAATGALLVQSADLSGDHLRPDVLRFDAAPAQALYRLRLAYIRTPGTTRVAGTLASFSVRVLADPQT